MSSFSFGLRGSVPWSEVLESRGRLPALCFVFLSVSTWFTGLAGDGSEEALAAGSPPPILHGPARFLSARAVSE